MDGLAWWSQGMARSWRGKHGGRLGVVGPRHGAVMARQGMRGRVGMVVIFLCGPDCLFSLLGSNMKSFSHSNDKVSRPPVSFGFH